MLTVPAHTRLGDVTVFRDDTDFFRFYAVPDAPRVRVGDDGRPVLLLVAYAVSDDQRATRPDLPTGGGYLVLDTVFEVPAEDLPALAEALAPTVAADWARLRAGTPEERARPGVAGTDAPPDVVFASPTWTSSTVRLDTSQATALVAARVTEGTSSLLTGNVASFNLDLTTLGADLVAQVLTAPEGGPDLIPLQVGYDLTCWARLPPASIHLEVDAAKLHSYVHQQTVSRGIDGCTPYEYERAVVDEESLTLSGAVTVQIDTGSGSLPDAVVAELRGYAFETLKQLVQSTFFTERAPAPPAPGEPPIAPPLTWGERTLVRRDLDSQTMSISLDLEQSSVVEWPLHPRGALRGLVDDPAGHVRRIPLDDPFFANLVVDVEVFADWAQTDHVDVELEHGTGADRRTTVLTLHDARRADRWTVGLLDPSREYRYRHRAVRAGAVPGPFTPWAASTAPRLPLSVPSPGVVWAEATAGSIDWSAVSSVQVGFAYEDPSHGVPREEAVVVLTAERREGSWERRVDAPVTAPVLHRTRFFLLSGDVGEEGEWAPVPGPRVVVNQPRESVLSVRLAPTGTAWRTDLVSVLVDLEYPDAGDGAGARDTFELRSMGEAATWRVYLRDASRRGYRHRWLASFADGTTATQGWTDNPGDPVLPVRVDRPGLLAVVNADLLDPVAAPLTEVSLRHDPTGATTTLLFRDRAPQTWVVAAPAGSPTRFTYRVTHFPADAEPVELPERVDTDTMIVLPPYRPAAGAELVVPVIGWLVDYALTPGVVVDLRYDDATAHEAAVIPLSDALRSAEWRIPVPGARISGLTYRLTYLTTGTPRVGEWTTADAPRVIVPALVPA